MTTMHTYRSLLRLTDKTQRAAREKVSFHSKEPINLGVTRCRLCAPPDTDRFLFLHYKIVTSNHGMEESTTTLKTKKKKENTWKNDRKKS